MRTRQSPSGKSRILTFQVTNDPGNVAPNVTQIIASPVRLRASDVILRVSRSGGFAVSQGGLVITGSVDASATPPRLVLDYTSPGGQTPGSTTYDVVVLRQ